MGFSRVFAPENQAWGFATSQVWSFANLLPLGLEHGAVAVSFSCSRSVLILAVVVVVVVAAATAAVVAAFKGFHLL